MTNIQIIHPLSAIASVAGAPRRCDFKPQTLEHIEDNFDVSMIPLDRGCNIFLSTTTMGIRFASEGYVHCYGDADIARLFRHDKRIAVGFLIGRILSHLPE